MAIQIITHKKIKKYDTKNPNFDPESLKKPKKEINGNVEENDIRDYIERVLGSGKVWNEPTKSWN